MVGQGYVGLPLALRAVEVGYDVVGFDLDVDRIKRLADGDSYVEDIADDRLAAALATGRYLPTDDPERIAGFDVAVIDVPTPLEDGDPQPLLRRGGRRRPWPSTSVPGRTVVLESTSYPGTTEELVVPILEEGSGLVAGRDFHARLQPRAHRPGQPHLEPREHPEGRLGHRRRVARGRVEEFYGRIVERTVAVSGTREAELTKLLENTFRHVNIALVNELAMFAADLDIDVWEAIDAASTKPFGYLRFTPGPGCGRPLPPHRPELPVVEGPAQPRPALPLRRAGQRRQRAHARLRRAPADPGPQPDGTFGQRAPGSCSSGWPTSGTPATPARRRGR